MISGGAHPASFHSPASPGINRAHAVQVVTEQINAMHSSGLASVVSEFVVGLNGDMRDYRTIKGITGASNIVIHNNGLAGELPTLVLMEDWVKTHPDWIVFYAHSKGVCWPGDALRTAWRKCLIKNTVVNWEQCVLALLSGCEMAGAHYLTGGKYPHAAAALTCPIWGGNWFWTTTEYWRRVRPVPRHSDWKERYWAEMIAGSGSPKKVMDFANHWPSLSDCGKAL